MLEQLRLLIKLQAVDKTLFGLEQEQLSFPVRLGELSLEEDRLTLSLNALQADLEQVTSRRRELETDNEAVRARLRKAESRLMGAKTQREYRAATAEIEEAKDSIKATDDLLVEIMERQEALDKQAKTLGEQLAAVSATVQSQRDELAKRAQEVNAMIQDLGKGRGELACQVEKTLLGEYDFIRQRRQGVALAPVKNGTCQICRMDIPPQQFNELQRLDKIMTCQSCARFIYWADADQLADLQ